MVKNLKWLIPISFILIAGWHNLSAINPRGEPHSDGNSIVVGAKAFAEGHLLGEIIATAIEANTPDKVTRKFELGGTNICFNALVTGAIDIYPEYTGTALVTILKEPAPKDPEVTYQRVKRAFHERYRILWLEPFGFNNTYALAIRSDDAKEKEIVKISDLQAHPELRAGFTREFLEREDGYPGLIRHYAFDLRNVKGIEHGLAYKAIQEKGIDIIDAYSTDGKLETHHLSVLEDDKSFFPPYFGAPIVGEITARKHPEVVSLLNQLGHKISDYTMRQLNFQIEQGGRSYEQVAQDFLRELGLFTKPVSEGAQARPKTFWGLLWQRRLKTLELASEHLKLTLASVAIAILVGVPFGILISRYHALATPVLSVMGIIQTIPSIALLGFLLPFLGIGVKPALTALFLYSLLPIIQNTYTGIRGVDPLLKEAGQGVGMTPNQILFMVELPLAFSFIMAGIRTSTVINIGTATLAAFIGAGGLGEPIVTGLSLNDTNIILSGAVPAAALALLVSFALSKLEYWASPKGLKITQ